ncbi:MAG: hypothetical protein IPG87_08620 [Saprospiraceae bacterium]|nr:hypothetical protein [Candidatus Vicinibacter affinis]
MLSQIGGKEAVKIDIDGSESTVRATSNLKANFGNNTSVASPLKRDKRTKRNQNLSFLLVPEAMHAGLDKSIKSYPVKASPADPILNITIISRAERGKPFHISEFTALRPDGLRYVYGIPAYNVKQVETSFAVDNESYSADCGSGLIKYDTEDGRPKHKFGSDHYLSRDETPPYAYCYLLTAILSEDYVDLTSDGPSSDDLGTYTKINYSRLYADYKWRVPYTDANFSEGLLANREDDKGNYLYGEKDIWIIQSIESKTQKAEFYYSDRRDGHGVRNESGGQDAVRHLTKLDRITLYSLPDLMSNSPNSRTPIKSVYFNYIYSLCPNVSTNDGIAESNNSNMNKGKLTLISLHFTYGLSEKGKFSPYKFEYNGINPTYSLKSYNRWGTYQPMNHNTNSDHIDDCDDVHKRITTMIPYIPQLKKDNINTEEENADKNSSAWSLTDIQLPSGSKISISYEADDYAYIQNKEAMQMIEITGTSKHSNGLMSSGIELDLFDGLEPYRYIYFDLYHEFTGSCSASQIRDSIQSYYIRDLSLGKDMLFKVFASLDFTSRYDFVQGYTKIDDWGAIKDGSLNYNKGFIRLALKCTKDKEWPDVSGNCNGIFNLPANPISKAIWQCARLNYPKLVSGNLGNQSIGPLEITDNEDDVYNIAEALLAAFDGFADLILGGTNNKLLIEGYGKKIMKGKSWLRLYNPNWKKISRHT